MASYSERCTPFAFPVLFVLFVPAFLRFSQRQKREIV